MYPNFEIFFCKKACMIIALRIWARTLLIFLFGWTRHHKTSSYLHSNQFVVAGACADIEGDKLMALDQVG